MQHSETPQALRLADALMDAMSDEHWNQLNADAATELRRLHAENEQQKTLMRQALEALERYQVKRQDFDRFADEITALREALKD